MAQFGPDLCEFWRHWSLTCTSNDSTSYICDGEPEYQTTVRLSIIKLEASKTQIDSITRSLQSVGIIIYKNILAQRLYYKLVS